MKRINWQKVLTLALVLLILPHFIFAQEVSELNQEIKAKQDAAQDIKKKAAIYQKNIRIKQEEAASLKNQVNIIENKIAKTKLDMQAAQIEVEKTQLEIRENELAILEKEDNIDRQKQSLSTLLQEVHKNDNENALKVFLLNDSLSDFFNEAEYTKDIQNSLQAALGDLKSEKKLLVSTKESLDTKQEDLLTLKDDLDMVQIDLQGETIYKENLLVQTKDSEQKFTELYWQAKQEQESISSEIASLEQVVRKKLDEKKADKPQLTNSQLSWPIPKNKITSEFHDPSYPFRYLFEHPAVDIRAGQATPIKAPAEGYVLKVRDAGMGYSYLALIHANGLSTVYGHVSKFFVKEDEYVSKGETVALTGGMPGTAGAGRLTTGPHLHFEVRVNGIPVNPLDYLP